MSLMQLTQSFYTMQQQALPDAHSPLPCLFPFNACFLLLAFTLSCTVHAVEGMVAKAPHPLLLLSLACLAGQPPPYVLDPLASIAGAVTDWLHLQE
jgi:hypothetical protein